MHCMTGEKDVMTIQLTLGNASMTRAEEQQNQVFFFLAFIFPQKQKEYYLCYEKLLAIRTISRA